MKPNNKLNNIKNWLRVGVKKILNTLAAGYIRTVLGHNSKVSLELGIGDLSYNSDEKILVSLTEDEAENLPKEDLMKILKFKTYHEVSHFLFTNDEEYREGMKIILEEFQKEADGRGLLLIKQVVDQIHDLMNSVEDGRIENILCRIYPGAKKHRDWYRLSEWKEGAVQEKAHEIVDLRNVVLTIATLGILTNGYEAKYPQGTVMFETAMKLAAPISSFVQAGEIKDGYEAIRKIAKIVAPWYVGTFGITEEDYNRLASSEKYSQQDLRKLAEKIAEQERNNKGQAKKEGKPSGNGPVVSVLKDDDPPAENGARNEEEGKKPDLIVDLRKNPPKMENSEGADDKDAPMYYRPDDLEQPESNNDSGSEGDSSSLGNSSEDKSSEKSEEDNTSKGASDSFDKENPEVLDVRIPRILPKRIVLPRRTSLLRNLQKRNLRKVIRKVIRKIRRVRKLTERNLRILRKMYLGSQNPEILRTPLWNLKRTLRNLKIPRIPKRTPRRTPRSLRTARIPRREACPSIICLLRKILLREWMKLSGKLRKRQRSRIVGM